MPDAGYDIDLLPSRGFQRGVTAQHLLDNLRMFGSMAVAMVRAVQLVRKLRPRVVVGVGGYASVPGVLAARLLRIPVVIHEQNAVPGLANKLAARLGARVAVSFPGTALPGAELTGNPVRSSLASVVREPDSSRPLLGVVGGSLGSPRLNDAALDLYDRWRGRGDVQVRHVAGKRHYDDCRRRLDRLHRSGDTLVYELVAYEDHMERVYATASLAVCRSGAVTVAELAAAGVPSVLVPWPGAPDDHQTRQRRRWKRSGGPPPRRASGRRASRCRHARAAARSGATHRDVRGRALARSSRCRGPVRRSRRGNRSCPRLSPARCSISRSRAASTSWEWAARG